MYFVISFGRYVILCFCMSVFSYVFLSFAIYVCLSSLYIAVVFMFWISLFRFVSVRDSVISLFIYVLRSFMI